MNFRKHFLFVGLSVIALSANAATLSEYRGQVENGWLQCLNPRGNPVSEITEKHINDALTLLQKTVDLHHRNGGVLSAEKSAAVKALEKRWADKQISADQYRAFFMETRWLRREILLSNPKLDFEKILINRTPPTDFAHNGDQHLGRHSRTGPGLTILDNWKTNPETSTPLADKLPKGAVRNPDLHFDAEKVVFAFCDHEKFAEPVKDPRGWSKTSKNSAPEGELERRYFLYEAALDGSWVRQLTGTKNDPFETQDGRATVVIEDNDPCYLPDDNIAFISTRSQTYGRCHGGRYNPAWILYRCDKDGNEITQLSFGNENEYEPSIINDGRMVFSRWEYTNRHEMFFHMLWWCRPDGTGVANYYGNDTLHPMMVTEQTSIPGTQKVVATAMGHHQYNTGTAIVIDPSKGENGEAPLTHLTPETPYSETFGWPKPHYSHPYPISENLFLITRANHPVPRQNTPVKPNDRAIYLIDDFGGREFIYEDPTVASFSPIPIKPRERPPMLPAMRSENDSEPGTIFLQNAYLTRNDPHKKIKPGDIKALRINALGVQPHAIRRGSTPYVSVEIPKKVLGTVPVNPDGSACFNVPSKTPIQLQALDKDGRAILTEKTFWYLQPGENRSCVGCHEEVGTSPDMKTMAGLMKNGPAKMQPAAGPQYEGGLAFAKTVQPVLDRYCISCHGLDKKAGNVNLLYETFDPSTIKEEQFPAWAISEKASWMKHGSPREQFIRNAKTYPSSYMEMTLRGDFSVGMKAYMTEEIRNISEAYEPTYSRSSKVAEMILKNHGKVNMDHDSKMRIIEWMDLNAPMNGDIFSGWGNRAEDRKFNAEKMTELRAEIKAQFGDKLANQPDAALVNRVFPQESRILMAPLAKSAGGWGQIDGWKSKDDPAFKKMEALVLQSYNPIKNENDMGWCPNLEKGGAESWIHKDQQAYEAFLKQQ